MSSTIVRRIDSGGLALGLIVRMSRSSEIAAIAKASDYDFIFIDCQHAAFSHETVVHLVQSARVAGLDALVRVLGPDDPNIPLWLDCGARGIIAPDLVSAEQARRFVSRCKFPPSGRRSFGGPMQHMGYAAVDTSDLSSLNAGVLCVGMIETAEAIEAVDEIAGVEGLDVLHVGMNDLSIELGTPGQMTAPVVLDAVAATAKAAARHSRIFGVGGDRDPVRRREYIRQGARLATMESDVGLLLKAATDAATLARQDLS
ncbi:2-keto-3-deoxy-L-rhamnonate aldolase RhmA [Mesorhizobium sp. J18]|uniref:HpcH/HpaI aldolase family protein n=1 Tax=Mesorhizobium sp. J18 TaxID=935263 RepID=UPI001199A87A|nr:aldolase/citrate lyase family protein [Mesorhizobium sp. J18]TWG96399.1 2-keto-3-deoxy-L-rhamnonate aldolase RhmA [Mesorhizobium sp. J18]